MLGGGRAKVKTMYSDGQARITVLDAGREVNCRGVRPSLRDGQIPGDHRSW